MKKKPIIGVTADYSEKETYSKFPWYALRENYVSSLTEFDSEVIILPCEVSAVHTYSGIIDGLFITGGDFDIDPRYYNQSAHTTTGNIIDLRTSFEMSMFNEFYSLQKPILGICGGEQLINVALGGTLIQHIPDEVPGSLAHSAADACCKTSHSVKLKQGSRLSEICGLDEILVNSSHHQAVKTLGAGLEATAIATDGVIEAIEDTSHFFCLGVQWHPEFFLTSHDRKIIKNFIEACKIKN